MKTQVFLLVGLCVFALSALGGSYRETTGDMYMESYMTEMRRQGGMTVAEIRAAEYRSRYEVCDEHHSCINVTANTEKKPVETKAEETDRATPVKFIPVPVWY